jgi:hypothetical protein
MPGAFGVGRIVAHRSSATTEAGLGRLRRLAEEQGLAVDVWKVQTLPEVDEALAPTSALPSVPSPS